MYWSTTQTHAVSSTAKNALLEDKQVVTEANQGQGKITRVYLQRVRVMAFPGYSLSTSMD